MRMHGGTDPAGTQIGAYLHSLEQASTGIAVASLPFNNPWAVTNCHWTLNGENRGQFHQFYMMSVLETPITCRGLEALTLMNCAFWQHIVWRSTDYPLYDIGETYDVSNLGAAFHFLR
jgi:hypothetical protein